MHELDSYTLTVLAMGAIGFGLWLLVKGGDITIDNAVRIAQRSGLSKLFIAATIVAFGTSAPELFTSLTANFNDFPGIAMGNVVGSNIANVLFIVGVSAIIAPVLINRKEVAVDTWMMIVATVILAGAIVMGAIPRWAGAGMFALIIAYVVYQYKASKVDADEIPDADEGTGNPYLLVFAGIAVLVIGAEILVQGAVVGGIALGVPESVIGMTVVAFGTSLPELVACVAAARKQQSEMIVGGIVGSNIFNILSVLGLSALTKPILIDPRFAQIDLPTLLVVTAVFSVFLLAVGKIGRTAGIAFVVSYIAFVGLQYSGLLDGVSLMPGF
jgi:cation:H+ antiporter